MWRHDGGSAEGIILLCGGVLGLAALLRWAFTPAPARSDPLSDSEKLVLNGRTART